MSHRSIAQWDQWLNQGIGQFILQTEKNLLETFLSGKYGKHLMLIGVPQQNVLIQTLALSCHSLVTPLSFPKQSEIKVIESAFYELPVISGSIDVVVLPHTMELVDNPRQLLSEACRIIKPEGHLIICGFNPYSLWGLSKILHSKKASLPGMHSIKPGTLKKWLDLSDFELVKQRNALYSPPMKNISSLKKLQFLEWVGNTCHLPCGALYVLMARAKFIPLTPIRLRWKQSIANMRIPTSIPGPTVRNAK
ncbi:MAG TPA: methyltransferase domain-containing protein [Gammaproteobacteria bacterium]|nr:methyltransferase domain-containing protein [Gammaproteobacteria bacterium]